MDDSLPGRSDSSSIYGRMRQYTRCKGNSKGDSSGFFREVETTKAETAAESEKETKQRKTEQPRQMKRVQQVIRRVWICRLQPESTI